MCIIKTSYFESRVADVNSFFPISLTYLVVGSMSPIV